MADKESMHYHVTIPDNQKAFLKFLCWNNGTLLKEPQNFVIYAHVFSGTSSAICSNYALRELLYTMSHCLEKMHQKRSKRIFM